MKNYDEFCKDLDQLSPAQVRERLETSVYLGGEANMARAWLARQSETDSAEQLSLARRAADEAGKATAIANVALKIAIVSMIITGVGIAAGIIVPHYWH